MAFIVPTFNIQCNVWHRATWWAFWPGPIGIPDLPALQCQLRPNLKNMTVLDQPFEFASHEELVVPKLTDLRPIKPATGEFPFWCDIVEAPNGSSRFYFVVRVVDVAKGFTNEYRVADLCPTWCLEGAFYNNVGHPHWPYAPAWPVPFP